MGQPVKSLLHIGGPKTGSTTLQVSVLSQFASIYHFGEVGDGITTVAEEILVRSLLEADDQYYDGILVKRLFDRHLKAAAGATFVFSSADVLSACRPRQAAHRLIELMPAIPHVLLVVRNQTTAIESYYSSHGAWLKPAPRPYYRAFVPFNEWLLFEKNVPYASAMRTFDYWGQLTPFIERVGANQTTVVAFEDLVSGDLSAWARISECLGVDSEEARASFFHSHRRKRTTRAQVTVGQLAGVLIPWASTPDVRSLTGPLGHCLRRGKKFAPKWPKGELASLLERFGEGNRALNRTFGLDLGKHGYPGVE